MIGLVKKDFYLVQTLFKSYALLYAVFFVLTLFGVYGSTVLTTFMAMMCIMIPVNTFSYDEQAHWEGYAVALPTGRAGYVQAKYLFSLLIAFGSGLLSLLLSTLLFVLGKADGSILTGSIFPDLVPVGIGLMMNALLLPIFFKVGVQKGRIFLMVAIGVVVAVMVALTMVLSAAFEAFSLSSPVLLLLPLLGLLTLIPSYFISQKIFRRKDL